LLGVSLSQIGCSSHSATASSQAKSSAAHVLLRLAAGTEPKASAVVGDVIDVVSPSSGDQSLWPKEKSGETSTCETSTSVSGATAVTVSFVALRAGAALYLAGERTGQAVLSLSGDVAISPNPTG
jgi:hypothetical protein